MDQIDTVTLKRQNWMWALRRLMGWPAFKPACDSIAFTSGRPMDFEIGMECGRLATTMRKDFVYSGWTGASTTEPSGYAVVLRELLTVDVVGRCVPWMAHDDAPLLLVFIRADEHFAVGQRGMLERIAGKPKKLAEGRRIATRRIRALAATLGGDLAENNRWMPIGAEWVEPEVPAETFVRFN